MKPRNHHLIKRVGERMESLLCLHSNHICIQISSVFPTLEMTRHKYLIQLHVSRLPAASPDFFFLSTCALKILLINLSLSIDSTCPNHHIIKCSETSRSSRILLVSCLGVFFCMSLFFFLCNFVFFCCNLVKMYKIRVSPSVFWISRMIMRLF